MESQNQRTSQGQRRNGMQCNKSKSELANLKGCSRGFSVINSLLPTISPINGNSLLTFELASLETKAHSTTTPSPSFIPLSRYSSFPSIALLGRFAMVFPQLGRSLFP
ncbi:hypothetical protein E2542_SST18715 [Spatholobus suberectus]|nr:hypothetical protein E2542_SST18715 [Spatholobus suberectus]